MESIITPAILMVIIVIVIIGVGGKRFATSNNTVAYSEYIYTRKEAIMTMAERAFYARLLNIAGDRYYVFPQIHLSAMLTNQTKGRYWKAAFQRINRTSVDYVLAHKDTLQVAYAVELDDWSHYNNKRKARDTGVEAMLSEAHIPLVRFRDVGAMSDDAIAQRFYEANQRN